MTRVVCRIRVLKAGLLTTVQDLGRWGLQARGVPPAGPMDSYSLRLANLLIGNPQGAACLEITLLGPELMFEIGSDIAVTGADFEMTLDDTAVTGHRRVHALAGSRLRFGARRTGARAYLAVAGGFDVPLILGSRATHLTSAMGGHEGRRLKGDDWLMTGEVDSGRKPREDLRPLPLPAGGGARLRVLEGPQTEFFDRETRDALYAGRYIVTPHSNRMAYRLTGQSVAATRAVEMISDATPFGGLQVPSSGQPILLMADRATTGGYPMIATVITADLPLAGQLAPGDWIEFRRCTRAEALAALIAQERYLS